MVNSYTSTGNTSWFSRMKGAIIGVLFGMIMIPGSVALHGWNEYRTIHRTQGLKQGAKLVTTVENIDSVQSTLDKELVHMTGQAHTDHQLRDDEFAIEENAIKLRRNVEMFQWVESESTRTKKKLGGGQKRTTTYTYDMEWATGREDSTKFEHSEGHHNPPLHFKQKTKTADHVVVGAYELNNKLINDINSYEVIEWNDDRISRVPVDLADNLVFDGEHVYWSAEGKPSIDAPRLGDHRIRFEAVRPTEVSLVAQQTGNTFAAFEVPNGEKIEKLYVGQLSAEKMFEAFQNENMMLAWILRAVGLVLACGGFFLIMNPLAVFADVVPIFGSMTRGVIGMVGGLLGVCLSATTISISWIAVRPLIGIPLLIVAVVSAVMIFRVIRKNKSQSPSKTPDDDEAIPYVPMA